MVCIVARFSTGTRQPSPATSVVFRVCQFYIIIITRKTPRQTIIYQDVTVKMIITQRFHVCQSIVCCILRIKVPIIISVVIPRTPVCPVTSGDV